MKTNEFGQKDYEKSVIEHERWTSAILQALHEMRCASASGLDRHGYTTQNEVLTSIVSPLATSIAPPPPSTSSRSKSAA